MIGGAGWGTSLAHRARRSASTSRSNYVYALAIAGSGLGMTAGFLIARKLDISAGDAALVNSGGSWGTADGALLAQSIFRNPSGSQFGWFMLGGTTAGVLTGSLLAWKLELSRGHVGLIDVGGLAGTGLGFALGYVIGVNAGVSEDNIQTGARYALGGMALGLLAGAVLSRKYKGDLPPVEALLRRSGEGRWAFGLPAFSVEQAQTAPGADDPAVLADPRKRHLVTGNSRYRETLSPRTNGTVSFRDQLLELLALAHDRVLRALHHDLGRARARVVVRRHREAVRARRHQRQQIALAGFCASARSRARKSPVSQIGPTTSAT